MRVIFDLDGTLALTEHRAHFLQKTPKDWRAFYAACDKDEPNVPIIQVLWGLFQDKHDIEIWSGRSKEVLDKTLYWISNNVVDGITLRMREKAMEWRPAFAWLPVPCGDKAVWLEDVERRVQSWLPPGGSEPYWTATYEYRLPEQEVSA